MKNDTNGNRKYIGAIIAVVSAIALFACTAFFLDMRQDKKDQIIIPAPERIEVDTERVIDFETLLAENGDTIGWIEVPGTEIDYPVVTCGPDWLYLTHDFHGQYDDHGTIFVDDFNGTDFSQLHTILYGHDMLDGSMFSGLHNYYDRDFFNKHRTFYIYTPNEGLMKYEVFAAYERDDIHILKTYDYNTVSGHAQYLQNIRGDVAGDSIIDEELLESLTEEDRIVTLSTCTRERDDWRFIVQGVYVPKEQE